VAVRLYLPQEWTDDPERLTDNSMIPKGF